MNPVKLRTLTETALLGVLLFGAGLLRLPSPVPGSEFQLSAPLAAAICGVFGFRIYLAAGLLASALTLLTGTGTIFHVLIAMIYRLTVGAAFGLLGPSGLFFLCAGPAGTLAALCRHRRRLCRPRPRRRAGDALHRRRLPAAGPAPPAGAGPPPGWQSARDVIQYIP